jgi:hypothetical protein
MLGELLLQLKHVPAHDFLGFHGITSCELQQGLNHAGLPAGAGKLGVWDTTLCQFEGLVSGQHALLTGPCWADT